jgi:sorbitol/mannitol transport system substrate-binding protein
MNWNATVDTPEQRGAWQMYKKILREAGQKDILSYTYNECIALMQSGKCGIYYDATSIAPPLESAGSAVRGKVGYALAPHEKMKSNTSWLWNWSMGINPKSSDSKKQAVFEYMLWATSKDYIKMTVDVDPTGSSTPPASRSSTYKLAAYKNAPYAAATLRALESMDFTHPTLQPVPYVGLQYIAIPEFADAGTQMTQWLADYVVDKIKRPVQSGRRGRRLPEVARTKRCQERWTACPTVQRPSDRHLDSGIDPENPISIALRTTSREPGPGERERAWNRRAPGMRR